jgi:hypothetical protein
MSFIFSSCWVIGPSVKGNGNVTEEVRNVGEFDQIEVSRGMNVYITQGSPAKVIVVADENLHEVIQTKENGGVLKIYADENIRWAKEKKVLVTVEKLNGLESTSGANVWSRNQILSENLELKATSGASITMEVNAKFLKADCSSGANINLSGLAKEAELESSSGANLKGPDLKADRCTMEASSGGNVSSTVVEKLKAKASSGGSIDYYGEPSSSEIDKSSGGSINKK